MSWYELEFLLLLSPGESIEVQDKCTRQRWQGTIDGVAPEHGTEEIGEDIGRVDNGDNLQVLPLTERGKIQTALTMLICEVPKIGIGLPTPARIAFIDDVSPRA
jgi:hypothetical protein